ncbi:MAG: hypothetical protein V4547_09035 [Bacteroidota bacterium]
MKEIIQAIGGILILAMIAALIGLVWFDGVFMMKVIITIALLILVIYILDKSEK